MNNNTLNFRYPGVKPFATEEQNLFFGRDEDIEKLYKTVSLEKLTVLYGKSGYGKSSLLNAGLIPLLLKNNYKPFVVRFGAFMKMQTATPVDIVKQRTAIAQASDTLFDRLPSIENSLWTYFKKASLSENVAVVLIFDQFEELFTYPDAQIAEWKRQIAEVLYGSFPQWVRNSVQTYLNSGAQLSENDKQMLANKVDVKVVFSIRSDRMSLLNLLNDYLPTVLQNNYELSALTAEQAEDAVLFPAAIRKEEFATPPFEYTENALQKILNYLTRNRSQRVESFQLQIVCQYCETQVAQRWQAQNRKGNTIAIDADELGNLEYVFQNHYLRLISLLPTEQQLAARFLFEDALIIDSNRVTLPEAVILKQAGMNQSLLKKLLDSHLLRSEPNTVGGISYELAHDTLVSPILEARKVRVENEEEERAKAEEAQRIKAEREKAAKEKAERDKKMRQQRLIVTIVGIAAVISLLFGIFGFAMWQKAEKQQARTQRALEQVNIEKTKTYQALEEAQESLRKFEEAEKARQAKEIEQLLNDAKSYMMFGKNADAKIVLQKILELDSTNGDAKTMLKKVGF